MKLLYNLGLCIELIQTLSLSVTTESYKYTIHSELWKSIVYPLSRYLEPVTSENPPHTKIHSVAREESKIERGSSFLYTHTHTFVICKYIIYTACPLSLLIQRTSSPLSCMDSVIDVTYFLHDIG